MSPSPSANLLLSLRSKEKLKLIADELSTIAKASHNISHIIYDVLAIAEEPAPIPDANVSNVQQGSVDLIQQQGPPKELASTETKIPKKPKWTGIHIYYRAIKEELAIENPGMPHNELYKICCAKWKNLSDAEKQVYNTKALEFMNQVLVVDYSTLSPPRKRSKPSSNSDKFPSLVDTSIDISQSNEKKSLTEPHTRIVDAVEKKYPKDLVAKPVLQTEPFHAPRELLKEKNPSIATPNLPSDASLKLGPVLSSLPPLTSTTSGSNPPTESTAEVVKKKSKKSHSHKSESSSIATTPSSGPMIFNSSVPSMPVAVKDSIVSSDAKHKKANGNEVSSIQPSSSKSKEKDKNKNKDKDKDKDKNKDKNKDKDKDKDKERDKEKKKKKKSSSEHFGF